MIEDLLRVTLPQGMRLYVQDRTFLPVRAHKLVVNEPAFDHDLAALYEIPARIVGRLFSGDDIMPGGLVHPLARLIRKAGMRRHANSHPMAILRPGFPEILPNETNQLYQIFSIHTISFTVINSLSGIDHTKMVRTVTKILI